MARIRRFRGMGRVSPGFGQSSVDPSDGAGRGEKHSRVKVYGRAYQSRIAGLVSINQKIARTAAKAGKPKANHHQNRRW